MRALAGNPHVHADEISVQVDGDDAVLRGTVGSRVQQAEAMSAARGGAVTLRGSLDLATQREKAERIAPAVPGVASVENRLSVRRTVSADDVAERVTVRDRLVMHPHAG
jgi:osmotically-inducible protein OsmY